MKMTKKIIKGTVNEFSPWEFTGTLARLKERVQEWIDRYGEDAEFDYDREHYHPYDQNPTPTMFLNKEREETDAEYAKRTEQEAKWKAAQDKRDREEFERLQKKFGKS